MDLSKLSDGQLGELEAARGDLTKLSDATLAALSGEAPAAAPPSAAPAAANPFPQDAAAGWATNRIKDIGTSLLGAPRATADFNKYVGDLVGFPALGTALNYTNPVTMFGQFSPSTETLNKTIKDAGLPEYNTPGPAGHLVDSAISAVGANAVMPGSFIRNLLPAVGGTLTSELGGQIAKNNPKYEPLARLLGGMVGGGITAGVQNAAGSVAQGVKNTVMPNPESVKIKAIARALERDQMTGPQFMAAQADLGPGAMAIEAGGPNMRGTMRAAIAPPGAARTAAAEAFDNRVAQSDAQTAAAINQHVSALPPVSTRTNTIGEAQRAAATPAYEAAGIPHPKDLTFTETTRPGDPLTKMVPILESDPHVGSKKVTVPGEPVTERIYNTPTFDTPALQAMLKDSGVTREAISAVRNMSSYKYLPENSMAMLDKSYKHLVAMESDARRAGQGTRANDIKLEREKLLSAITEANPKYQAALDAFSGPQGLIDAANLPQKIWNRDGPEVSRQYKALTPDQQAEFRGGLADLLRTAAGGKDTGVAAQRIWGPKGDNQRARIEAVLGEEFPAFAKKMENQVNVGKTRTDINAGSRTAPMLAEMADGMNLPGMAAGIATGHPLYAMVKALGTGAMNRISTGASEKSNAAIAKALTSADPQTIGLVASLAEKQRLTDMLTSRNRKIALGVGAASPIASGSLAEGLENYKRRRAGASQ